MPSHRPVIGLEIHIQLATASKLFCGCRVEFGAEPNSRTCPVCLGLPGALPVMNRHALQLGLRMALALNCRIANVTRWDRKHYYYPDLPKNYQISQYDLPLGQQGRFAFPVDNRLRHVRIKRVHLEEDAGKNIHDHGRHTLVDLNRTGAPLLEVVTEPDLAGADETHACATELQRLATYLEVSGGVMQKGQMRFEPNVNVRIDHAGQEVATPICEIKNLNSFRALRGAVQYEVQRQVRAWCADPHYTLAEAGRENRGWDDHRQETVYQRGKELAPDYRYFPDPDLVPVIIEDAWVQRLRADMVELPVARRLRLVRECALDPGDALQIVQDRATADLFDAAVRLGGDPGVLTKHFVSFYAMHANQRNVSIAELGIGADRISALARLVSASRVSATAAATIAQRMLESDAAPAAIAAAEGLEMLQDAAAVEALVDEAIAANPQAAELVRTRGKKWEKSLRFLQGQVMQRSKGSAPPRLVRDLLAHKLGVHGDA